MNRRGFLGTLAGAFAAMRAKPVVPTYPAYPAVAMSAQAYTVAAKQLDALGDPGISLRLIKQWDGTVRMDVLHGVGTLYPEYSARITA